MPNEITIRPPYGAIQEPENAQWKNRFKIKSESSNRMYLVAQNKKTNKWGCSCAGYISHRHCKHLTAMGVPDRLIHGLAEKRLR